mmetsp:Transcript_27633/g.20753  ORF Transcript_27633/g.20753 Transcript_27633/m.20753 type:complete len:101 (+) Transcript_27633:275-577(+)
MVKAVKGIYAPMARYRVPLQQALPGNLILLEGVDESIQKTAAIVGVEGPAVEVMAPLDFGGVEPVVKVACEPLNPSELPKMLEGIRKVNKSYPMVRTKVE